MLNKLIGLGLLVCLIFMVGCAQTTATTTTTSTTTSTTTTVLVGGVEYFPNTNGYSWNYRHTSTDTTHESVPTLTSNGFTTIYGNTVQIWRSELSTPTLGTSSTYETYLKVTTGEVSMYGTSASPTSEPTVLLSFPLQIGSRWNLLSGYTSEAIVTSFETISVPFGTFECFRVDLNVYGISPISSSWYARNVGMVKSVVYTVSSGVIVSTATQELTGKNF